MMCVGKWTGLRCVCLIAILGLVWAGGTPGFAAVQDATSEASAEGTPAASEGAAAEPSESSGAAETEEVTYVVPDVMEVSYSIDSLFLFLSAILVIFMQAGFSLVEVGLNSAKNAVNILFKNAIDFCIGVLLFYLIGYALMYPGSDYEGGYFGFAMPSFESGVTADDIKDGFADGALRKLHPQVDFMFQAAFCATAATIVSGAVAGRMKFSGYLVYTVCLTGIVYPIVGFWKWGGGWLAAMEFHDFAGSAVVHACGGFAGLAGAIMLGPRIGRYSAEGKSIPIMGHNLSFAALGVFILLIGWYGFNPGSQLAFSGEANVGAVCTIAVNTTLAAAAGGLVGMVLSWMVFKKPDLTMCLNGILGGLVGITANCDCVSNASSMIIGAVAGVLGVVSIIALDKLKIDDPVGAFPVHGVCGIWGCVAAGIFGGKDLVAQIIGSLSIAAFAFVCMLAVFAILKAVNLLRVSRQEEIEGLDMHEHGMPCYAVDSSY